MPPDYAVARSELNETAKDDAPKLLRELRRCHKALSHLADLHGSLEQRLTHLTLSSPETTEKRAGNIREISSETVNSLAELAEGIERETQRVQYLLGALEA
jgi:hypothetical protein